MPNELLNSGKDLERVQSLRTPARSMSLRRIPPGESKIDNHRTDENQPQPNARQCSESRAAVDRMCWGVRPSGRARFCRDGPAVWRSTFDESLSLVALLTRTVAGRGRLVLSGTKPRLPRERRHSRPNRGAFALPLWRPRHKGRAFALALHHQLRTRLSKAEMRKFEWHGEFAHALSTPRFRLWSRRTFTGRIRRFHVHSSQNASPLVVQCPDLHAYSPGTRIA